MKYADINNSSRRLMDEQIEHYHTEQGSDDSGRAV